MNLEDALKEMDREDSLLLRSLIEKCSKTDFELKDVRRSFEATKARLKELEQRALDREEKGIRTCAFCGVVKEDTMPIFRKGNSRIAICGSCVQGFYEQL